MQKLKNFNQLIGRFDSPDDAQVYKIIEKKFDLKQKYSERDWLTQNRQEVPQSYTEYYRTQIENRNKLPRVKHIKIV